MMVGDLSSGLHIVLASHWSSPPSFRSRPGFGKSMGPTKSIPEFGGGGRELVTVGTHGASHVTFMNVLYGL